jgi:hypothetical protein
VWKEDFFSYVKVLSHYSRGEKEENYENHPSGLPVTQPKFEQD